MQQDLHGTDDCRRRYLSAQLSGSHRRSRSFISFVRAGIRAARGLSGTTGTEDAAQVFQWVSNQPRWFEVHDIVHFPGPALLKLDPGEREAIQLASENGIRRVLLDEARGRAVAEKLGFEVRGILGVLQEGVQLGRVDYRWALKKLDSTNFRMSPRVREEFIRSVNGLR